MTTTTAPTAAPVSLPTRVIAEDAELLARAARVLQDEHVELVLDEPDPDDPPDGVVVLWATGDLDGVVDLQRLLAGAGIPAVVLTTEVLDPNTTEKPADPGALRTLTAHHEAGHAVAGCMRGSVLRSVCLGEVAGDGLTVHRGPSWADPFVGYAGPWAEARYIWGDRPADAEDAEGLVFGDYLFGIFLTSGAEDLLEVSAASSSRATERTWACELRVVWPAIEATAVSLLAGEVITDEGVGAAIRGV